MLTLTMGANAPIDEDRFELDVDWPLTSGSLDCSAFLLASTGRVRSDADFVFYNQPGDESGSVTIVAVVPGRTRFAVDLARVSADVDRVVVCAVVDGGDRTMRAFDGAAVSLLAAGEIRLRFEPDLAGSGEVALRLAELYRRGSVWKFRADGQGFNAGLGALAESFGVDVANERDEAPIRAPSPAGSAEPSAPSPTLANPGHLAFGGTFPRQPALWPDAPPDFGPAGEAAPVVGVRVAQPRRDAVVEVGVGLDANREEYVWPGSADRAVSASVTWKERVGGLDGRPRPLAASLGAYYQLEDGARGTLQLPDCREAPKDAPVIRFAGPSMADGEAGMSVTIDAERWSRLSHVTFYVFLDGAPNWKAVKLNLELTSPGSERVFLSLNEGVDGCGAVALLRLRREPAGVRLSRLALFGRDQREIDLALDWGLAWCAGTGWIGA